MCLWAAAVAVLAVSLGGCSGSTGIVQGRMLVFGAAHDPGVATTLPVARFQSTVLVEQGKRVVARHKVVLGARFHFSVAAGVYDLTATGVPFCHAQVRVTAGQTIKANVRCGEP
jgi:hypothetical protein